MERKIGEIFEIDGDWFQCVEDYICDNCSHIGFQCISCPLDRKDKRDVYFKKLKKVGNPYYFSRKLMQTYKLYTKPVNFERLEYFAIYSIANSDIHIEIKQNQEDMEEKKLNLKPFDLEVAKQGKPVCTRDGRKARIICFDVKAKKPIAALITNDDTEEVHFYYDNGRSDQYQEYRYDLMMFPEKKEGWVNIYRDTDTGRIWASQSIYKTELAAMEFAPKAKDYIATVKIEWEE